MKVVALKYFPHPGGLKPFQWHIPQTKIILIRNTRTEDFTTMLSNGNNKQKQNY